MARAGLVAHRDGPSRRLLGGGQRRRGPLARRPGLGQAGGQRRPRPGVGQRRDQGGERPRLLPRLLGLAPGGGRRLRGGHQGRQRRAARRGRPRRRRRPPAAPRAVGGQARPLGREVVGPVAGRLRRRQGGRPGPVERGDPEQLAQDVVAVARPRPEEAGEAPLGQDHRAGEGLEAQAHQLAQPVRDHGLAGHALRDGPPVGLQALQQVQRLGRVRAEAPGGAPDLVAAREGQAHLAVGAPQAQQLARPRELGRAAVEREADRVEQRALAGAGVAGDHHQAVAAPVHRLLVVGAEAGEAQLERPHGALRRGARPPPAPPRRRPPAGGRAGGRGRRASRRSARAASAARRRRPGPRRPPAGSSR